MPKAAKPKPEATLSKYQKFAVERLHRSQLKGAPYNPRLIDEKAKQKLRANLKKVGLLEPIIWNRTTGNLVGGHQRLSQIDSLEGTSDYYLDVSVVELDLKTEKEQNIFLNNQSAMGRWDLPTMAKLYQEDGIGIEESGFDFAQVHNLFGNAPTLAQPEALQSLADKIRELDRSLQEMGAKSKKSEDYNFYLMVIFANHEERQAFMRSLGEQDNQYLDARVLTRRIAEGEE